MAEEADDNGVVDTVAVVSIIFIVVVTVVFWLLGR